MIWVGLQRLIKGKKEILILGKGPTQGLEHTLSTEKKRNKNDIKMFRFVKKCLL